MVVVVAAAGNRLYSAGAETRVLNEPTAGSAVMLESTSPARPHDQDGDPRDGMIRIPGGTFRMGSDKHYPEEAPVHRVAVDAFWMDRTPVTNRQFKAFVRATGHVTSARDRARGERLSRRIAAHAVRRLAGVHAPGAAGGPAQLERNGGPS